MSLRRGGHRPAHHPTARRDPRAPPVRDQRGRRSSSPTSSSSSYVTRCPHSPTAPGRGSGRRPTPSSRRRSRSLHWPRTTRATRARRKRRSSERFIGYGVTQILCYVIGLLALVTVARNPSDIYGAFIAVPLGSLGFAILATRELDQSFANVYSTAVSIQNLRPLWDRRVLAVGIAVLTTTLALWVDIADYENFLDSPWLGLRPDVRRPCRRLLRALQGALGPVGRSPVALGDAGALGRGLRHLPAHQPRLHLVVGLRVDASRPCHRVQTGELDVRVDLLLRRRRRLDPHRRRDRVPSWALGEPAAARRSTMSAQMTGATGFGRARPAGSSTAWARLSSKRTGPRSPTRRCGPSFVAMSSRPREHESGRRRDLAEPTADVRCCPCALRRGFRLCEASPHARSAPLPSSVSSTPSRATCDRGANRFRQSSHTASGATRGARWRLRLRGP